MRSVQVSVPVDMAGRFRVPASRLRCATWRCPAPALADESPVYASAAAPRWRPRCRDHLRRPVRDLPDGGVAIQWTLWDHVEIV